MKIGEVSGLIEIPPYYQIVKLMDSEEGEIEKFATVKEMIKRTLGRKKYQSLLEEYLVKLRHNSSIHINEDVFNNFKKKVENVL